MNRQTVLKSLSFLGAAICEGQTIRGVEMGPSLIRQSGVLQLLTSQGIQVRDEGDINVSQIDTSAYPPVKCPVRNLNVLGPLLQKLHFRASQIIRQKDHQFLLTVGGDHSVGAATIAAVNQHYDQLKVVWVDAHPDFTNAALRSSGKVDYENYHGMPLSHLTGVAQLPQLPYFNWIKTKQLDPRNVVLIAIRDIDPDEYVSLERTGLKCFTMDHVDKFGIGKVMSKAIEHLDPRGNCPFHLSFDVDGVDPELVSQTGTRFRYGLSGRQSIHIVRRLAHQRKLVSMDLVEINKSINQKEQIRPKFRGEEKLNDVTHTVGLGVDLITSLNTRYFTL